MGEEEGGKGEKGEKGESQETVRVGEDTGAQASLALWDPGVGS